jgi:hypothetical protein
MQRHENDSVIDFKTALCNTQDLRMKINMSSLSDALMIKKIVGMHKKKEG